MIRIKKKTLVVFLPHLRLVLSLCSIYFVAMVYSNTDFEMCQVDTLLNELHTKFEPKKHKSLELAQSYSRLNFNKKSERVSDCGSFLEFVRKIGSLPESVSRQNAVGENAREEHFRLRNANFCKDKLCPMCAWRRSYKIFSQISRIVDVLDARGDYSYIFLTLTVPNCVGSELSSTIDCLQSAWNRFIGYKKIKDVSLGYFKALEVTRNNDFSSKSYGTYHPHFHVIIVVNKDYFKKSYITRNEWLKFWQKATRNDAITQVDVRRATQKKTQKGREAVKKISSAIAEVAKYSVKSSDYLFTGNSKLTDEIVSVFNSSLSHRRLVSFGGIIEKIRNELKLDDCENGDLVNSDLSDFNEDIALQILRFKWSAGVYKLITD